MSAVPLDREGRNYDFPGLRACRMRDSFPYTSAMLIDWGMSCAALLPKQQALAHDNLEA
jgi:hypothetical protein